MILRPKLIEGEKRVHAKRGGERAIRWKDILRKLREDKQERERERERNKPSTLLHLQIMDTPGPFNPIPNEGGAGRHTVSGTYWGSFGTRDYSTVLMTQT